MSGPCSMCEHFTMEDMPEKLSRAGFGRCLQMRSGRWQYQSQGAACAFEPPRFVARVMPEEGQAIPADPPAPADDLPEELTF